MTSLVDHEKPHRTDSRRDGVVHPCFVRGGRSTGDAVLSASWPVDDCGMGRANSFSAHLIGFVLSGFQCVVAPPIANGLVVAVHCATPKRQLELGAWSPSGCAISASGCGFLFCFDSPEGGGCLVFFHGAFLGLVFEKSGKEPVDQRAGFVAVESADFVFSELSLVGLADVAIALFSGESGSVRELLFGWCVHNGFFFSVFFGGRIALAGYSLNPSLGFAREKMQNLKFFSPNTR